MTLSDYCNYIIGNVLLFPIIHLFIGRKSEMNYYDIIHLQLLGKYSDP